MLIPVILLLGTLLIVALVVSAIMPLRVGLVVGCATTVCQLYTFPVLGVYISVALLAWLSLWPAALPGSGLWRWGWMRALAAFNAAELLSVAWSPNKALGLRYFIYSIPLLIAAHAFYASTLANKRLAQLCLHLLLASTACEALAVILFRLSPSLELAFLRSALARLFISANALFGLFTASPNNVLDPDKAGGVFLNANVAAAFLGSAAIAAWYCGTAARSWLLCAVAALDWLAVPCAGSKAGLVLALVIPVTLGGIEVIRARQTRMMTVVGAALAVACGILVVGLFWKHGLVDRFQHASAATLASRGTMWRFARDSIRSHPLLGLGYGGWEKGFPLYAFMHGVWFNFPPHNSLLIAWIQSGLPGIMAGILWIVAVYLGVLRVVRAGGMVGRLALGVGGAFTWYLLQGFGENMGLVGEVHMTPFFGVLLGYMCARYEMNEVTHADVASDRGVAATPAVPAI